MRVILIAGILAVALAAGSAFVLNGSVQETAYQAYATSGARVGNPGDNLVGQDWKVEGHRS